jgi:hypothetical protein
LILGDNGVGKTTLMQLLALGAVQETRVRAPDGEEYIARSPRLSGYPDTRLVDLSRTGQIITTVKYDILWADSLEQPTHTAHDESTVVQGMQGSANRATKAFLRGGSQAGPTVVYGYGANRRRAPNGMTSEASDDPSRTLFDDDATLRNPEEWLLQNELVANTVSPLQGQARRQRARVIELLTRILPGVDEIRVSSHGGANQQLRASAEVHGPDGWVPFSALGLGYRTMTGVDRRSVESAVRALWRAGGSAQRACRMSRGRDRLALAPAMAARNLFPLSNPENRAKAHRDSTLHEQPVFIDPSTENPELYVSYREHVPIGVGGNLRRQQTIEALGLRRPDLNEDRAEHLARLTTLHAVALLPEVPDKVRADASALLTKAVAVDGEYSLMCRVAFAGWVGAANLGERR